MSKTSILATSVLTIAVAGYVSSASADQRAVERPSPVSMLYVPLPSADVDGLNSRDWEQVKKDLEKIIHDRLNRGLPPIPRFRSPSAPCIDGCKPSIPELAF
ncbi:MULTISPECIES: hypothetical protein [unclassified Bradyrhizobium]|uniref:hypothetical protein n=1 Tax=unclassified Bradyrhizobium TaxID=2631580 RepID=UPI001FFAE26A|nr:MULTISPECIES: hypothetical protein [unclassified Bradyrhizobium]MCK1296399.1 hypothetical protein [Bradyrhizobium sp. 30]MCK1306638.1 hypothetical protein [Bradyrhizobium sp. 45]MCK1329754.1 hypothetical protein [Bradyrhizobium sp. CW9]MCK1506913.1 hypothetical protein [Bradyrhizobium sp. 18]MCK1612287.1 hypothetical protein [Bradyrhizobium sp. 163]